MYLYRCNAIDPFTHAACPHVSGHASDKGRAFDRKWRHYDVCQTRLASDLYAQSDDPYDPDEEIWECDCGRVVQPSHNHDCYAIAGEAHHARMVEDWYR